jgi:hypothetical protein
MFRARTSRLLPESRDHVMKKIVVRCPLQSGLDSLKESQAPPRAD